MRENCERCGEPHASYRHVWMDNELEHKMYYQTVFLCEQCAWALRDAVRAAVRAQMEDKPEPVAEKKKASDDEECFREDFEIP